MVPTSDIRPQQVFQVLKDKNASMHVVDIMVVLKQKFPSEFVDLRAIEYILNHHSDFVAAGVAHTYALRKWGPAATDANPSAMAGAIINVLKAAAGPMHISLLVTVLSKQQEVKTETIINSIEEDLPLFRLFAKGFIGLVEIDYPQSELAKTNFFISGFDYVSRRLQGRPVSRQAVIQAMKGRIPLTEEEADLWIQLNHR